MRHEVREKLKAIAHRVSDSLMAELQAGELAKVGIDEIRAALRRDLECPPAGALFSELEGLVCRRMVEMAR
jgi:hypothetical protein